MPQTYALEGDEHIRDTGWRWHNEGQGLVRVRVASYGETTCQGIFTFPISPLHVKVHGIEGPWPPSAGFMFTGIPHSLL